MAKAANKEDSKTKTKILTPPFRASYPHLFKASQFGKNDPQFSITGLFTKTGEVEIDGKAFPVDMKVITKAIHQAKVDKWGPNKANWPKMTRPIYGDGDGEAGIDKKTGERKEGYEGCWVIRMHCKEDQRPGVYDESVQPITNPSDFYPGCFARAEVFVSAWDNEFGKGVSFYLNHVQKLGDGDSFGGRTPGDQVFTPVNSGRDEDDSDEMSNEDDDEDFT